MPSTYYSSLSLLSISLLASSVSAESTTTATVLVPNWCVTQSAPTVTASAIANNLTVYSYQCSINTAAINSAQAKASSIFEGAQAKASSLFAGAQAKASEIRSQIQNIPIPTPNINFDEVMPPDSRILENINWKRDDCFGLDAFDVCIPWEVTMGPSYWAVHFSTMGVGALQQECTFKTDAKTSGTAAVCTASGRLDPKIWGDGQGSHTKSFSPADIDKYFIRNTVAVTTGGAPLQTGGGVATTGKLGGTPAGTAAGAEDTGLAARNSIPGGAVAMLAGAGGILAAAIAL